MPRQWGAGTSCEQSCIPGYVTLSSVYVLFRVRRDVCVVHLEVTQKTAKSDPIEWSPGSYHAVAGRHLTMNIDVTMAEMACYYW
jgi:hypothetical protein